MRPVSLLGWLFVVGFGACTRADAVDIPDPYLPTTGVATPGTATVTGAPVPFTVLSAIAGYSQTHDLSELVLTNYPDACQTPSGAISGEAISINVEIGALDDRDQAVAEAPGGSYQVRPSIVGRFAVGSFVGSVSGFTKFELDSFAGTFEISSVDADGLRGSFDFQVTDGDVYTGSGNVSRLVGSFDATECEPINPDEGT